MSDAFCTWQDLLEDEEGLAKPEIKAPASVAGSEATSKPKLDEVKELIRKGQVPQELAQLLEQHEELEQSLKSLTGHSESKEDSQDEERNRLMYPVFAHTKETQLQEKRLRARDERRMAAQKRRLENKLIEYKRSCAQAAKKDERQQKKRIQHVQKRKKIALASENKKRRQERALIEEQREQKWQEQQAEALRARQIESLIQQRWQAEQDARIRARSIKTLIEKRNEEDQRDANLEQRRIQAAEKRLREIQEERRRERDEENKRIREAERRRFG